MIACLIYCLNPGDMENIMSTNKKINLSLFMMLALFFILINNVALSSPNGQKTSQSRLSIQMPDGFDNYVNSWQYSSQSSHKAIYIAIDGYTSSGWAAGMCYGGNSLSAAKTCALNSCNSDRALMGINAACTIYAENNQYVYYDSFDSGLMTLAMVLITIPSIQIPLMTLAMIIVIMAFSIARQERLPLPQKRQHCQIIWIFISHQSILKVITFG